MSAAEPLSLAILISGRGSNMLAIASACARGALRARVALVIADRDSAPGIAAASELAVPVTVINHRDFAQRADFETALSAAIDASGAQLVVLAGFMRILSPGFTGHYSGRLLNIHPSLLPHYKGLHTHRRVLAAGEVLHGVSVHYVSDELDGGPVVRQARIAVHPEDTEGSLSARIQALEHIIYPQVIGWIADERLQWRDGAPRLDGRPLLQPVISGEFDDATSSPG